MIIILIQEKGFFKEKLLGGILSLSYWARDLLLFL